MKNLRNLLLLLNAMVVLLTLVGYLGSHVNPRHTSIPQAVGLFMPLLLSLNLFFLGLWAVLRKKYFMYSLLALLLGYGQIQRLVGLQFGHQDTSSCMSICSYNGQNYNESDHIAELLKSDLLPENLDILCLQEVSKQHIEQLKKVSGFPHSYYHLGKFTLSSFPIIKSGEHQFDGTVNGFVWTDLETPDGILRLFNVHLRSNRIASTDLEEFSTIPFAVSNYRSALLGRAEQVKILLAQAAQSPHPILVAGDFNDSPFSYTYQQFADQLHDHFRQVGLGIGSTYAESLPGLKIDYIFADDKIVPLEHRILRTKISDHFPLLSHFNLNP